MITQTIRWSLANKLFVLIAAYGTLSVWIFDTLWPGGAAKREVDSPRAAVESP